ncbi:N-terminal half of MaoC dehydratase [Lysobacter sp. yr284]|uniref:FAS1-like dehydratase domain-containing protein n=1 Tax=Lysobacter sp. yr284 TaxID=1761791 RepID=UPI0008953F14|nr:MaoC family dehydratase N-terminal domain-containing protein [Lysobacter sp. yr284]SDZ01739.1 N-terminal half of MaoC dehydratase [Lysobacter sp. yr284]
MGEVSFESETLQRKAGEMPWLAQRSRRLLGGAALDVPAGVAVADWLAISRYVAATGDDNPLYLDPVYGAGSWWRTQLAPPGFVLSIAVPESVGALYEESVDAVECLDRVELWWNDHIRLGDRVGARSHIVEAGPGEDADADAGVEVVTEADYRSEGRRIARARGRVRIRPLRLGSQRLVERDMHRYTPEQVERIEAGLAAEPAPRGGLPRFHGELAVGEALPPTVRGPMTWSELQSWMVAEGRPAPAGNLRHRELLAQPGNIRAHAATDWAVCDRRQAREDLSACADVGFPAPSIRGSMAVALATQQVTAWMGDAAFLRQICVSLPAPVLYGDTLFLGGRVADKYVQRIDGREFFAAALELHARNQLDETVMRATAIVFLPERGRPLQLPIEAEMF